MIKQDTTSSAFSPDLLRLLTCGSVDDGKSTLIGRVLLDTQSVEDDTLESLANDSKLHGTTGDIDPSLLTDGLKAEREQRITIDVAYRYFKTEKRHFIIADTPGHVQYTRNMATGASTANLAIVLVDARNGLTEQTRRHAFIASLLGIKHIVVAINKMDLVDFSEDVFSDIRSSFTAFSARLSTDDIHCIPISALNGDNVVTQNNNMPWYKGSTLLHHLETVHIASDHNLIDMRFPVQYVNRPSSDYRGYCGTLASGILRKGDRVTVLPSKTTTTIESIDTFDGEPDEAWCPQAISVRLNDDVDVSRGDMLVPPRNIPDVAEHIEVMLIWMSDKELAPGNSYICKHTSREVPATVQELQYTIDMHTLHRKPATTFTLNDIGRCRINLQQPIFCDPYSRNRSTGCCILIDPTDNTTVAAGLILDRNIEPESTNGTAVAIVVNGKQKLQLDPSVQSIADALAKLEKILRENGFDTKS